MADAELYGIGVRVTDLVSGFAGGVVNALFFMKNATPRDVVASVIGGAITTAYLAPWVARQMGTDTSVIGFIIGLTAMAICQQLLSLVPGWVQKFRGGGKVE